MTSTNTLDFEHYDILDKIGEGANGIVFKAKQKGTGQKVAIKVLKMNDFNNQSKSQLARFSREREICSQIDHPHIVKTIDGGQLYKKRPYTVFEFVSGVTLKQYIISKGGLPASTVKALMLQIINAIMCAHDHGAVHRDLKPQNIMVLNSEALPHVKVLDFGMGMITPAFRSSDYQTLTLTHEYVGTPNYSSPEQLRGEFVTQKSDIFALGLILIECLTGKPVIRGRSLAEVFQRQLLFDQIPIPPSLLGHPLGGLLRRMLDKNPIKRPDSAKAVFETLQRINFENLTGVIKEAKEDTDEVLPATQANTGLEGTTSKKQITVMVVKLELTPPPDGVLPIDILEALEKDQLYLCQDAVTRLGGFKAIQVTNHMIFYFGYPDSSDSDARRAAQSALEVLDENEHRNSVLNAKYGVQVNLKVVLNTGQVLITPNKVPDGLTVNTAFDLLFKVKPGKVHVTHSTQKLLKQYSLELVKESLDIDQIYAFSRQSGPIRTISSDLPYKTSMVGRMDERDYILSVCKDNTSVKKALLLSGTAGIGKSRLLADIKVNLQQENMHCIECQCMPEHTNNALHPVLRVIKSKLGLTELPRQEQAEHLRKKITEVDCSEKALPLLYSWLSIIPLEDQEVPIGTPEENKTILFQCLRSILFKGIATILIIEDLHWIDPTTLEFLNFLLEDTFFGNNTLLLTSRENNAQQLEISDTQNLVLDPIDKSGIAEIISNLVNRKPVAEEVIDYISERTDGIPLFVEELTGMLLEEEYLIISNGVYSLITGIREKAVPTTLVDLLSAKLENTGEFLETAQLASAIGREFDLALLSKASQKDEDRLRDHLHALVLAEIVVPGSTSYGQKYSFRHALVKDVAYESMPYTRQKETHMSLAKAISDHFPQEALENPFELACHWAGAERYPEATDYGLQSVKRLVANSSNKEALLVNRSLLKWLQKLEGQPGKEYELMLNDLMLPVFTIVYGWGSSEFESVVQRNHDLIDQLKSTGDNSIQVSQAMIKSEWMLFSSYFTQRKYSQLLELGDRILKRLKIEPDHQLELAVSVFIGQVQLNTTNFKEAQAILEDVIKSSEKIGDITISQTYGFDPAVHAHGVMSLIHSIFGKPESGRQHAERGIVRALQEESIIAIATAYLFASLQSAFLKDRSRARDLLNELFRLHGKKLAGSSWEKVILLVQDWVDGEHERAKEILSYFIEAKIDNASYWYEYLLIDTLLSKSLYNEAINWLNDTLQRSDDYAKPMLYRQMGLAHRISVENSNKEAHSYFLKGILLARKHGTLWFELELLCDYFDQVRISHKKKTNVRDRIESLLACVPEGEKYELFHRAQQVLSH